MKNDLRNDFEQVIKDIEPLIWEKYLNSIFNKDYYNAIFEQDELTEYQYNDLKEFIEYSKLLFIKIQTATLLLNQIKSFIKSTSDYDEQWFINFQDELNALSLSPIV